MAKKLQITLKKSLIGRQPKHIQIAHQLGLRKINQAAEHNDNPAIRGLVAHINYLVDVEECKK